MAMRYLVTGGAGFIGSAVVREAIAAGHSVCVFDKLTYAGNLASLAPVSGSAGYEFYRADICDAEAVRFALEAFRPDAVLHLAAESHVDRSIDGPGAFVATNVTGTFVVLDEVRRYLGFLDGARRDRFRFIHVSTDEVYGSLGPVGLFHETTAYDPRSPYSASKAASDHLARAWWHTYGLPTIVTNCSNNYGPYHFPEKLIPLVILNAIEGRELPVYGKGENVRDWLFVEDHARALLRVAEAGTPGETYNIGGRSERRNIDVVGAICDWLDVVRPKDEGSYYDQVRFVTDRPGHDARYAIDCSKIERELGWKQTVTFEEGLGRTVDWYLANESWWSAIRSNAYRGERLGLSSAPAPVLEEVDV